MPANLPVWDTGLTCAPDPAANFTCTRGNSPFSTAPTASWAKSLEQIATPDAPDPDPRMGTDRWRVSIMAAPTGTTYLHP